MGAADVDKCNHFVVTWFILLSSGCYYSPFRLTRNIFFGWATFPLLRFPYSTGAKLKKSSETFILLEESFWDMGHHILLDILENVKDTVNFVYSSTRPTCPGLYKFEKDWRVERGFFATMLSKLYCPCGMYSIRKCF